MSRRQNKFAQKRYNIASEEVNIYPSTLSNFKANGYPVMTGSNFNNTQSETLRVIGGANALTTTDVILPLASFVTPSVNGITLASNVITCPYKGLYNFVLSAVLSGATTFRVKVEAQTLAGAFSTFAEQECTVGAAVGANPVAVQFNFPLVHSSVSRGLRFYVSATAESILSSTLDVLFQGLPSQVTV